jgi:hypothetical protein
MEEVEMQKKEVKEEVKEKPEENKEEKDFPKGFYLAELPESYRRFIAFEDKEVDLQHAVVQILNHLKEQTGFKLE